MAKTFARGIEVPHYKAMTENQPIQELPLPTVLVIPLKQHLGGTLRQEV